MKTEELKEEVMSVLNGDTPPAQLLQGVCSLLCSEVEKYHWTGYYFVDAETEAELVLGPFDGAPTGYTRIAFGQGVCGQSAETQSVLVVDDVATESNYLSCSPAVKSEFVVPVLWKEHLVAVLDLDSNVPTAFKEEDVRFLKWVADVTADTAASASGFRFEKLTR